MRLAAVPAALLALPVQAETCAGSRASPEGFEEGPCTVEWGDAGARVTQGARTFDLRERGRQGQWSSVTLNGQPAMRHEVDRETQSHAALDLDEFLDIAP